jgi:hypothetical protein
MSFRLGLQLLSLLFNGLACDPGIFDLCIPVCEATALGFTFILGESSCLSGVNQFF